MGHGTIRKLLSYLFLTMMGVETKYGNCVLYGIPLIKKTRGSRIIIGSGVTIISNSTANIAGVNNRTIIATLSADAEIHIMDGSGLSGVKLVSAKSIYIGRRVGLGVNTVIYDTDFHPVNPEKRAKQTTISEARSERVFIDDDVLIGANTIILKGCRILEAVVVGAGSVVAGKTLEKRKVYAGNPVREIGLVE